MKKMIVNILFNEICLSLEKSFLHPLRGKKKCLRCVVFTISTDKEIPFLQNKKKVYEIACSFNQRKFFPMHLKQEEFLLIEKRGDKYVINISLDLCLRDVLDSIESFLESYNSEKIYFDCSV